MCDDNHHCVKSSGESGMPREMRVQLEVHVEVAVVHDYLFESLMTLVLQEMFQCTVLESRPVPHDRVRVGAMVVVICAPVTWVPKRMVRHKVSTIRQRIVAVLSQNLPGSCSPSGQHPPGVTLRLRGSEGSGGGFPFVSLIRTTIDHPTRMPFACFRIHFKEGMSTSLLVSVLENM